MTPEAEIICQTICNDLEKVEIITNPLDYCRLMHKIIRYSQDKLIDRYEKSVKSRMAITLEQLNEG